MPVLFSRAAPGSLCVIFFVGLIECRDHRLKHRDFVAAFLGDPAFPFGSVHPLSFGHLAADFAPRFVRAFAPAFFPLLAGAHGLLGDSELAAQKAQQIIAANRLGRRPWVQSPCLTMRCS